MCIYQIAEKKYECSGEVRHLFIDFKKACDSVEEVGFFYNAVNDCGVHVKLDQLMKMYLNDICNKIWIGKHLSATSAIQNGLKKKDMCHHHCFRVCH